MLGGEELYESQALLDAAARRRGNDRLERWSQRSRPQENEIIVLMVVCVWFLSE